MSVKVAELELAGGYVALVDAADLPALESYVWHVKRDKNGLLYARRYKHCADGRWEVVYLHRILAGAKKGQIVHHRNTQTLDNRRSNLVILPSNSTHTRLHLRKRWAEPAARQAVAERMRERMADPAARQAQAERSRQCWADPALRATQAERTRKRWAMMTPAERAAYCKMMRDAKAAKAAASKG